VDSEDTGLRRHDELVTYYKLYLYHFALNLSWIFANFIEWLDVA